MGHGTRRDGALTIERTPAPEQSGPAWWDHVVQAGRDLGARLSSQERALRNARAATTVLSRARVERDAVELYLADHEERLAAAQDDERVEQATVPRQRRDADDRPGAVGHAGA